MKRNVLFLLGCMLAIAACDVYRTPPMEYITVDGFETEYQDAVQDVVVDDEYDAYLASLGCGNAASNYVVSDTSFASGCARRRPTVQALRDRQAAANVNPTASVTQVKYSMPNGNDLVLETPTQKIQVAGAPGQKYDYYVWFGDRSYVEDPDMIVSDGEVGILVD